jgi:hypothetical protein
MKKRLTIVDVVRAAGVSKSIMIAKKAADMICEDHRL